MNALLIDSTDKQLRLILLLSGKTAVYIGRADARRHTAEILTAIDSLLKENGLSAELLDVVGAVTGPGSFTGIRIGAATANAFSMALGVKLVEITSLEPYLCDEKEGLALLDCKNDNFYALKKRDGNLEYLALNKTEAEAVPLPKIIINGFDSDKFIKVFSDKIKNGLFVDKIQPFYLKKSSAERN